MGPEPGLVFLAVVGEGATDVPWDVIEHHPTVTALAPRSNVKELYAAADVFLNCSRSEGMPYAVLEALACGLPVVATDLPVARYVLDGLPGARVIPPEPRAMAAALREVLAFTPAERAEHADAARTLIATSYALEPWARRLVTLYAEALGETQP
jgi:glycosyltransferase involved in cell wall biosynthesis